MTNNDYEYYRTHMIGKIQSELRTIISSTDQYEIDTSYQYIRHVLDDFVDAHKDRVCETGHFF
jgi:hypothetical protein